MRKISGFENSYAVTEDGRVWSYKTGAWLKPRTGGKGYLVVSLCKDGKPQNYYIHRLVARAYVPNEHKAPNVNHKDGSKRNNAASNLEWCTQMENITHSWKSGLSRGVGEQHYQKKLNWKKVDEIRTRYTPFTVSVTKLASEYGVSRGTIQDILENRIWRKA